MDAVTIRRMQARVLVLCDMAETRQAIAEALAGDEARVTLTADTAEARREAAAAPPDAVVAVDGGAAEAQGLLRSIRAAHALHGAMFVAVAVRDAHADLMQAGADQVLDAAASPEEIRRAVQGRLRRRTQLLELGQVDARRRSAESMVAARLGHGRLRGVIALRIERLDAVTAAMGGESAQHIAGEFRRRLGPLLPDGCEMVLLDHGVVAAVEGDDPQQLARAMLHQARQPLDVQGRSLRLRTHAGICHAVASDGDAGTLLRRAEVAAREAADQGLADPHAWDAALGHRLLDDLAMAHAIREAVEHAAFRLVLQPQVRMDRGEPFGAEALIRWTAPGDRPISTARFVQVAEDTGLMDAIGAWSLREACRQAVAWDAQGLRLRVSVNATPHQLLQADFAAMVQRSLAEGGLSGERLVVEVPERAIATREPQLARTLESLRSMGVTVAVDDFGAGLATVAALRDLAVQELKIDRMFIRALPGTPQDRMAVETVLQLAQRLGLRTVAVGVEHAAQWAWLKEQGCDAAQGWLIGRPVEADHFVEAIAALRRAKSAFTGG